MAASLPKRDVVGSPEDKAGSSQALSSLRDVPERRAPKDVLRNHPGAVRTTVREPVQWAFERTAVQTGASESGDRPPRGGSEL